MGHPLWSFLTQMQPSALLHTKVSLTGRAATLMCRPKGLEVQEIPNWFNKNGQHIFLKLFSEQVTKIESTTRTGKKSEECLQGNWSLWRLRVQIRENEDLGRLCFIPVSQFPKASSHPREGGSGERERNSTAAEVPIFMPGS